MSGHSHAKNIAHVKSATDQKRGQTFSKMARLIAVAVRAGGSNIETNSKLKTAIERAKSLNMPNDNIERAVKSATGGADSGILNEIIFEAYGPGGIAMIIEGITDNKNRALGELKQIISRHGGKLAQEGSVRWMFERKGCITLRITNQSEYTNKENLELLAIEAGAEDLYWYDDSLDVYTNAEDLEKVKKNLEEKGAKIDSASLDWKPKEMIVLKEKGKEAAQKLFEELDENNDIQDVYSNLKD